MVQIFSNTTSLLSTEFVDSFPTEKLAIGLYKIAKDAGIELVKEKKTYLVSGDWKNVQIAHDSLNLLLKSSSSDFDFKTSRRSHRPNGVSPTNTRGRKPGSTVEPGKLNETDIGIPKPLIVQYGSIQESQITKTIKDHISTNSHRNEQFLEDVNNSSQVRNPEPHSKKTSLGSVDVSEPPIKNITGQAVAQNTTHINSQKDDDKVQSNEIDEKLIDNIEVKIEPIHEDFDEETDIDESYMDIESNGKEKSCVVKSETLEIPESETPPIKKKGLNKKKRISGRKKKSRGEITAVKKKNRSKSDVEFSCDKCDYKSKMRDNFREHVKRMHTCTSKCDECGKTFGLKKDLTRHMKTVHTEPSYVCDSCGKLYKSKRAYNEHMRIHEADYSKPYFPCDICGKTFTTKYVLTAHVNSEHLGVKKSYVCPTCGRTFTQKHTYLMHANVHAGIKPYVCDVCGKSFSYDKSLREHKYMHEAERRFECEVCHKMFRQRTSLMIHLKVHKATRDYICQSCGKGFTQRQALTRHERIHSGEKPFKCALCSRTFSDYSIIRRHMIMLHKKDAKLQGEWKKDIIFTLKRKMDFFVSSVSDNSCEQNLNEHNGESSFKHEDAETTTKLKENSQAANTDFHLLERASFIASKEDMTNSQSPINYSVGANYTSHMRPSGDADTEESLAKFQSLVDSYRTSGAPRDIPVPGLMPASLADPLTSVSTSSSHPVPPPPWGYPGFPYYNPAAFTPYHEPPT